MLRYVSSFWENYLIVLFPLFYIPLRMQWKLKSNFGKSKEIANLFLNTRHQINAEICTEHISVKHFSVKIFWTKIFRSKNTDYELWLSFIFNFIIDISYVLYPPYILNNFLKILLKQHMITIDVVPFEHIE